MPKLAPATQAVCDAFWGHPNNESLHQDRPGTDRLIIALRALADRDEVVEISNGPGMSEIDAVVRVSVIHAIADELKGNNE